MFVVVDCCRLCIGKGQVGVTQTYTVISELTQARWQ